MSKGKQPLLYTLSSVMSWVVDTGGFFVLNLLLGAFLSPYAEPVCNVLARIVSSLFNFGMNYRFVFGRSQSLGRAMFRYYCLAVPQLLASTGLLTLLVHLLKTESAHGATAVKIAVDGCLFVASFFIQKYWVFRKKDSAPENRAEKE